MTHKFSIFLKMLITIGQISFAMDIQESENKIVDSRNKISEAIWSNDLETVKKELNGVDVNGEYKFDIDNPGVTLLNVALIRKKNEIAKFLINAGMETKWTLFFTDEPKLITALVQAGADVNELNAKLQTPLDFIFLTIIQLGSTHLLWKCVLVLIKNGAQLNFELLDRVYTSKEPRSLGYLKNQLPYKAFLYLFYKEFNNGLEKEKIKSSLYSLFDFCRNHKMEYRLYDAKRNTFLHQLILQPPAPHALLNAKIRLLLYNFPKLLDAQNKEGDTALHCAIREDNNGVASLLFRLGADITMKNNRDQTPWDLALSKPRFIDMFTRGGERIVKKSQVTSVIQSLDSMEL